MWLSSSPITCNKSRGKKICKPCVPSTEVQFMHERQGTKPDPANVQMDTFSTRVKADGYSGLA